MKHRERIVVWLAAASLGIGCSGGGGSGKSSQQQGSTAELALSAGLQPLSPAQSAQVGSVDLARLGVSKVDAVYELTTPAGEAFAFNLLARGQGNAGAVRVSLAHAADGGVTPPGGVDSIRGAGVLPSGAGVVDRAPWLDARGDGFARLTLSGSIAQDQELLVQAETPRGIETALVRVRVGARSPINVETQSGAPAPFVLEQRTLYSSDSWMFGLPTCATSGDRTSVVVYEGDEGNMWSPNRYEMRLQVDGQGNVTGGAQSESSPDAGNWRDHELAALFNVLALAHAGDEDVSVRLSFDRGATFAQEVKLHTGLAQGRTRLVQTAMAADYTLAVLFWRQGADDKSELVLVEGGPDSRDTSGSPTSYAFGPQVVVFRAPGDVTPAIMGAAYSQGGDLVIGYGFTQALPPAPNQPGFQSRSEFRCAVRLFGETSFFDSQVDEDISISFDPEVALVGQGAGLNVLYAYETSGGVRLRRSQDAGRSFGAPAQLGDRSANLPSVLAAQVAGVTRVDLLWLEQRDLGQELRLARWDDFDAGAGPAVYSLTTATQVTGPNGFPTLTGLAWLGYDACLAGDDVVIVYHETTQDAVTPIAAPAMGAPQGALASAAGGFQAATPPPLAPGLTTPLAAPNPAHRHQLKLIRLD